MSNKVVGFVAKSDQRKMADRTGDADNFRTAKRITGDGVVTMRTQGKLRSRFELEEEEASRRVSVPVPTLTEIDLSGAATQTDRLYYHADAQDEMRVWSSDGLLSMVVTPLQRIIFKTSEITPSATFSLWLCNEDEQGVQSAPVVTGDANPVAQEVAGTRTYHNETYVYPRNDTLVDYSSLKGIGFALKRISGISAILGGQQYTFSFAGFDQSRQPVPMLGLAECPTPIEQNFTKRKYSTSGVKQIATVPARIKLAEPGGLLPFAKKSITLAAKEHSGNSAVVRPINDLCRVEAFGQPWHGYLRFSQSSPTVLFDGPAKVETLYNKSGLVESNEGRLWHQYVNIGGSPVTGDIDLRVDACFQDGHYSPLSAFPVRLESVGFQLTTLMHMGGKVWNIEIDVNPYNISVRRTSRFDDFLGESPASMVIGTVTKTLASGSEYHLRASSNGSSCVLLEYNSSKTVNRHWLITFESEVSASVQLNGVPCGYLGTNLNYILETSGGFNNTDGSYSTTTLVSSGPVDGGWETVEEHTTEYRYNGGNSGQENGVAESGTRILLDLAWAISSAKWVPVVYESVIKRNWLNTYSYSGSTVYTRIIRNNTASSPGVRIENFSHSYSKIEITNHTQIARCGISCVDGFLGFVSDADIDGYNKSWSYVLEVVESEASPGSQEVVATTSAPVLTSVNNEVQVDLSPFTQSLPKTRLARQSDSNSTRGHYVTVSGANSPMVLLGRNVGAVPATDKDFVFNPRTQTMHAVPLQETGVFF
ncbi:MAG: hypothetical protein ACKO0Z_20830 [Betaproteobacteria bacterium]